MRAGAAHAGLAHHHQATPRHCPRRQLAPAGLAVG